MIAAAFLPLTLLIAIPPPARVAFVGDSHMQALGPLMTRRAREAGYQPVGVIARQGWSSSRYRTADDLESELRAMRPDVVVIVLGSNDYGVARASRYRSRLRWIVDAALLAGAVHIEWHGPPAGDPDASDLAGRVAANHDRIADLQREIFADDPAVTWTDSRPLTRAHVRGDGYHLTRAGYAAWATYAVTGER